MLDYRAQPWYTGEGVVKDIAACKKHTGEHTQIERFLLVHTTTINGWDGITRSGMCEPRIAYEHSNQGQGFYCCATGGLAALLWGSPLPDDPKCYPPSVADAVCELVSNMSLLVLLL